jgi:hypothetical protein
MKRDRRDRDAKAPAEGGVPAVGGAGGEVRAPELAGLGTALQVQAEILRRLHDQQAKFGEILADQRRSELMIQSTQALNDAFTGMREVQEKLVRRLETEGKGRGRGLLVALGLILVAVSLVFGFRELRREMQESAVRLAGPREPEVQALKAMERLESRVLSMEAREKGSLLADFETLRKELVQVQEERRRILNERDQALQDLGAVRATLARREGELEAERERSRLADQELARLQDRALADQRMLGELNKVVEDLRGRLPVAAPAAIPLAPDAAAGETRTAALAPEVAPPPRPAQAGPVDPALLDRLNLLLSAHRGSEVYELRAAREVDGRGLLGVILQVRGRDGSLAKSVEAERLEFTLTARTNLLELDFEGGTVAFQSGIARTVKSPFFNNRYQIVIIGAETRAWMEAGLPFLRLR